MNVNWAHDEPLITFDNGSFDLETLTLKIGDKKARITLPPHSIFEEVEELRENTLLIKFDSGLVYIDLETRFVGVTYKVIQEFTM